METQAHYIGPIVHTNVGSHSGTCPHALSSTTSKPSSDQAIQKRTGPGMLTHLQISALEGEGQEEQEYEASPYYIRPSLKTQNKG